jgi:hypothetical protein
LKTTQDFRLMSEEEISSVREKVKTSNDKCTSLYNKLCWAMVIPLGTAVASGPLVIWKSTSYPVIADIAMGLLALAFVFFIATDFVDTHYLKKQSKILDELTPLSKTSNCSLALSYVKRYPEAREVHSKAIAAGRQLYMFDYMEISRIAEQEDEKARAVRAELEAEKQAKACRELHGIPVLETT